MKITKKIIKVGNKQELKTAILSCRNADCDTLIVLNGKTEYLIYAPFEKSRIGILSCETDKIFLQVIKNINKISQNVFVHQDLKLRRKGFHL